MSGKPKVQAHQNKTVYKPNRGMVVKDRDKQALQAAFSASMAGICERCAEQVKWKHKYGKFKLLGQPRKCNGCEKKTVRAAYHNLCRECAASKKVCCKCQSSPTAPVEKTKTAAEEAEDLAAKMAGLRERERRAVQRALARGEKPAILGGEGGAGRRQRGGGDDDDDSDFDDSDFDDDDDEAEGAAGKGKRAGGGGAAGAARGAGAAGAGADAEGGGGGSDDDDDDDDEDDDE